MADYLANANNKYHDKAHRLPVLRFFHAYPVSGHCSFKDLTGGQSITLASSASRS